MAFDDLLEDIFRYGMIIKRIKAARKELDSAPVGHTLEVPAVKTYIGDEYCEVGPIPITKLSERD